MHRTSRPHRHLVAALLTASTLALAGCSADSDLDSLSQSFDLSKDDPMGYVACRDLVRAEKATGDEREERLETVAAEAASSETESIRSTVDPPVANARSERVGPDQRGRFTVDPEALRAGCEEAGFTVEDAADD